MEPLAGLFAVSRLMTDVSALIPLLVAVSLVYAATRHEEPKAIGRHALRLGLMITFFMAIVFAFLLFFDFLL